MYEAITLGPTEGQLSDLSQGNAVLLSAEHLKGDVTFHLTKAQLARVQKALEKGKGCKLSLSKAQIKHMAQHGSGRFSDMLKNIYSFAKPALRSGLKSALNLGKDFIENKIVKAANLEGDGWFSDILRRGAHGVVDFVADKAGGGIAEDEAKAGLRGFLTDAMKRDIQALQKVRQQQGSGWFSNLVKGLAHGGVDLIANAVGGALIRPPPAQLRVLQDLADRRGHKWLTSTAARLDGDGFFSSLFGGAIVEGAPKQANIGAANEALRASLFQKKVNLDQGSGLRLP